MMEKRKTGRDKEVKHITKMGERGRIRNPSGTGTISSQHLPQNLAFLQACHLLTASESVWLLPRDSCEGTTVLAIGRKHKVRLFFYV